MIIKGKCASLGETKGIAKYYKKNIKTSGLIILVDGNLTPEIALKSINSRGVVASKGGITSHGANIIRELGIPCLVGADNLTKIKDGSYIILDCFNGTIKTKNEI